MTEDGTKGSCRLAFLLDRPPSPSLSVLRRPVIRNRAAASKMRHYLLPQPTKRSPAGEFDAAFDCNPPLASHASASDGGLGACGGRTLHTPGRGGAGVSHPQTARGH